MTRGHGWSLAFTMWRTCTSCILAGFYRRFLRRHQISDELFFTLPILPINPEIFLSFETDEKNSFAKIFAGFER